MPVERFKQLISEARTEIEVRRLFHWYFGTLTGTLAELADALAYVDARAEQLQEDGSEISARGGRGVPNGDLTACAA